MVGAEQRCCVLGGDAFDLVDLFTPGYIRRPATPSAYLSDSQLPIANSTAGEA